jgi:hypothetical protein
MMTWVSSLTNRLPGRRFELFLCLVACLLLAWPTFLVRDDPKVAPMLVLINLEVLLPTGIGIVSAGLLAGDPVRELLLTSRCPARHTLVERIFLLWVTGSFLALLVVFLATRWEIALPQQGFELLFIWLPPLAFFSGIANLFALARGRAMDGVIACLLLAVGGLTGQPVFIALCGLVSNQPDGICPFTLINPFLTTFSAFDPIWPTNRLVVLLLGSLGLHFSMRLAGNEEGLVSAIDVEG